MSFVYRAALILHIVAGVVGLVAFWTPALARKGGVTHRRVGRVFYWATAVVAATGLVMAGALIIAPLAVHPLAATASPERAAAAAARIRAFTPFLIYLLLITFTPVYHGARVLATRHDPSTLRTAFHTGLNVAMIAASAVMVVLAVVMRQPVFGVMSIIGFLAGPGHLQFARRPYPTRMAWWYEHMGSMIGGGIAFHTAFLVLGLGRLTGLQITGAWAAVPWILPTLIGLPASVIWTRYYQRKFGELPVRTAVRRHGAAGGDPAS
jgi:hypothetical protein